VRVVVITITTTTTQVTGGEEQIWTYSTFLDAYLEIGNWENAVSEAKGNPTRAHKRLVNQMLPTLVTEPEGEVESKADNVVTKSEEAEVRWFGYRMRIEDVGVVR
jgi:hypothetical protein